MSTIQVINAKHPSSATNNIVLDNIGNAAFAGTAAMGSSFLRNRIINGDMRIDQRNNGASGTANGYTIDRWFYTSTQSSKGAWQRNAGSVTPPAGFTNYLGFTSSSAYSVLTGDTFFLGQYIEGFNASDLGWGTANARTVTLSFWVRSSLTGTFGASLTNNTGRSYPFSYSVSSANTWEQKTVTIPGDTSGTWLTDNGIGIGVWFGLGSGATFSGTANAWAAGVLVQPTGTASVVGTNGATFYITGVQLEVGSAATPFERRQFGTEMMLCQRYYTFVGGVANGFPIFQGYGATANDNRTPVAFPVRMRVSPTAVVNGTWTIANCSQPLADFLSPDGFCLRVTVTSIGAFFTHPNSTDDSITFSAEL